MSIATADNFKLTNPKPFNELELYPVGDGTYRHWASASEVTSYFAGPNMSPSWAKYKFFWIAGIYHFYTGTDFVPIGAPGNIKGVAYPSTTPQAGATPEAQYIYFAGPGTYANFPDASAQPILLTENLNVISWDGTAATFQGILIKVSNEIMVNDLKASIDFNATTNQVTFDNTFFVINQRGIITASPANQVINLLSAPAVLYITPDGAIGTKETSILNGVPNDAVIFATYSKVTADTYEVQGLKNYSINGINQRQNNFFLGDITGTPTTFNFDTVANTISTAGTNIVTYLNKQITLNPQVQSIPLPPVVPESSNTYILYVTQAGLLGAINQSNIASIPFGSVKIGSFYRAGAGPGALFVTDIENYTIDGIVQSKNNYFTGIRQGADIALNFDLTTGEEKLIFTSTNVVLYGNNRIVISPQNQTLTLLKSGLNVIYAKQDGTVGIIPQGSISTLPFGAVVFGTYQTQGNSVTVTGIENYLINGIPSKYCNNAIGKLVSQTARIDIQNLTMVIKGGAMLIVGNKRYPINVQSVNFSSNPSVFYLIPSTGVVGTAQSSSISIPADAILFAGHYGSSPGKRFEFWGIDRYTVMGFDAATWEKKIVQKKLLTDFNPTYYYYKCNTTESMSDDDPVPLSTSDPQMMHDKYDALMAAFPDRITKEHLTDIPTSLGNRPIDIYTYTPPSVDTSVRGDGGIIVLEIPHIYVNCSIHGFERIAAMCAYLFFYDVLYNWQSNKVLEWFHFNVKISINPTANPAGWVNGTRYNGNLVDLNRNFPYLYIPNQNAGGEEWSGLAALDQPESLAINTWLVANKDSILLGIDFHNFLNPPEGQEIIHWTEGVNQFTNQLGRIAAQRISRDSRGSSPLFPSDLNTMLGTASYVTAPRGRLSGQIGDLCPYGLTFEVNENFIFDPNHKANDNNALKLGTECFGNALTQFVWNCMQDYNAKLVTYADL